MKNIIRNIFIVVILNTLYFILYTGFTSHALALSPTPTLKPKVSSTVAPKPTTTIEKDEKLIEQINNLKEKVASKVAELQLVEKRGVIGMVKEVQGTNKILLNDTRDNQRIVDIDELTKFSSPTAKSSFGISDITPGTILGAIGLYNKDSKRLLARFVDVTTLPVFVSGQISEVDKANYTITVVSENKSETLVDIENITKTSQYTEADGVVKFGFSKLTVGNRVHVVGYLNKTDKKRISATRILVFPELPKNPKIVLPETTLPTDTEIPATTSGKKATPTL